MTPAQIRANLVHSAWLANGQPWPWIQTDKLKGYLELVAGGKANRYRLTRALFGVEKIADVGAPERWALWAWLNPQPAASGHGVDLAPHCAAEAAAVLAEYDAAQREAQRAAGQLDLL